MTEDPLFEPWSIAEPDVKPSDVEPAAVEPSAVEPSPAEPSAAEAPVVEPAAVEPAAAERAIVEPSAVERSVERVAKWRSRGGARGVPMSRPVPAPHPANPDAQPEGPTEPPPNPVTEASSESNPGPSETSIARTAPGPMPPLPEPTPAPQPVLEPTPAASPPPPVTQVARLDGRHVALLRELLAPRLADLRQRLEMARHETTLDDRLDLPEPSVRFRVRPRPGPFDEGASNVGSVLEVRLDVHAAPEVVGRLWLDPLATGPGEQVRTEADRLTGAWIDELLLDFLKKTLRLG